MTACCGRAPLPAADETKGYAMTIAKTPWGSDTTWVLIYAAAAALFVLAWAYVPA
jgi:hypothetical protein